MSPTIKALGIDRLTFDQRIILVQEIWDMISTESHPPLLSESQRKELERRVAEDDAAPDDIISWEQVKSETLSRLRQS